MGQAEVSWLISCASFNIDLLYYVILQCIIFSRSYTRSKWDKNQWDSNKAAARVFDVVTW